MGQTGKTKPVSCVGVVVESLQVAWTLCSRFFFHSFSFYLVPVLAHCPNAAAETHTGLTNTAAPLYIRDNDAKGSEHTNC